jgi:8-oxo-dGTP pyrophosphatase MutT (NUDIX family)
LAQRATGRRLDIQEAGRRVTTTTLFFRFDESLRNAIGERLARFEVRRCADAGGLKRAAVAVVVVESETGDDAAFLLTKRTPRLRAHGGQWALPGGRVDAGETIEQTALRELHEELGVEAASSDVLGALDDYPTRSGFLIAPVVMWLPAKVRVTPNPAEVAAAYRIHCAELFRPDSPEIVRIPESDRPIIRLPLSVAKVNAPTAAVLFQFKEVALAGRDTRVDHFEQPVFAWR